MREFKLFTDIDKEETWLTEMAQKGYELESVSFGHKFRSINPEATTYRIDYRTFKKKGDFIDYCLLFEDTGWKHIVGTKHSYAQYFKKIDENAQDDIFSDAVSKAGKYKRFSNMWMTLALTYLIMSIAVMSGSHISMLDPKSMYLTRGIWDMTGGLFWKAFLFETPFVILRSSLWLTALAYVFLSIKARMFYNKQTKLN